MDPRTASQEEILATIIAKAEETKVDEFKVRVQRRLSTAGVPEAVAVFEGGRVEHFVNPEPWLPKIAGGCGDGSGSTFMLTAYHSSNPNVMIGGPLFIPVRGSPHDADPFVVDQPNWSGPRTIIFPEKKVAPQQNQRPMTSVSPAGAPVIPPRPEQPGSAGGGDFSAAFMNELRNREHTLAEREKAIEVENVRRESNARVEALERRLAEVQQRPVIPPAPTGLGLGEAIKEVMPLVLKVMEGNRDTQIKLAEMEAKARERFEAAQERAAERAERQAQAAAEGNKAMFAALATKKPEGDSQVMSQMMANMSQFVAASTGSVMNMISAVTEMGLGQNQTEQEPAWIKGVREAVKALVAMQRSGMVMPQVQPQPQPQLQPGQQPQGAPQQKQPARAVPVPKPNGTAKPQTAPAPAPAPQVVQQPTEQGTVEVEDDGPPTALDHTISLLEQKTDPKQVADFVFDHINSPDDQSILHAFGGAGGDFRAIIKHYLPEWLPQEGNLDYARQAVRVVASEGISRGIFPPDAVGDLDKLVENFDATPEP